MKLLFLACRLILSALIVILLGLGFALCWCASRLTGAQKNLTRKIEGRAP